MQNWNHYLITSKTGIMLETLLNEDSYQSQGELGRLLEVTHTVILKHIKDTRSYRNKEIVFELKPRDVQQCD